MQRDEVRGGTTIRNPSTANLLIDSEDRPTTQSSADFIIQKNNSILNGFFSRIAVAEVILNWSVPNVSIKTNNNVFSINIDGVGQFNAPLIDGIYTVAQALDVVVVALNALDDLPGDDKFIIDTTALIGGPHVFLTTTALSQVFTIVDTPLARQLGFTRFDGMPGVISDTAIPILGAPFLLPYRYIDFVSHELTYNQALKDATTNTYDRTVLYRWYFAWDESPALDAYGFPILQGYTRFCARRDIAFPKQIRWENNMPIGQVSFQVYNDQGALLLPSQVADKNMEWGMALLVSED